MELMKTLILKSNNMVQAEMGSNDWLFDLEPESTSWHLSFLSTYYQMKLEMLHWLSVRPDEAMFTKNLAQDWAQRKACGKFFKSHKYFYFLPIGKWGL